MSTLVPLCDNLKAAFIASNGQTQTNRTRKLKKAYGERDKGSTVTIEYKRRDAQPTSLDSDSDSDDGDKKPKAKKAKSAKSPTNI